MNYFTLHVVVLSSFGVCMRIVIHYADFIFYLANKYTHFAAGTAAATSVEPSSQ
jgi:hypothetical protein